MPWMPIGQAHAKPFQPRIHELQNEKESSDGGSLIILSLSNTALAFSLAARPL